MLVEPAAIRYPPVSVRLATGALASRPWYTAHVPIATDRDPVHALFQINKHLIGFTSTTWTEPSIAQTAIFNTNHSTY